MGGDVRGDGLEHPLLDAHVLADDLDDPVGLGEPRQVVLEVADLDHRQTVAAEQRRRP